jgi:nucleoside-diphosphate-sugar epimerase
MNILITGHKGFVGRHYLDFFDRSGGHKITGIDIKEGNDCRDFFKVSTEVFDLVIHLAAIVGGREKIEGDPISVASDLAIDSDMFNWAVRTKQSRVIYFSSSAAYPIHLQSKDYHRKLVEADINLNDIRSPDFTYGWAKLSGEYLAQFARKQGVNVHVFRPFSGYGERQDLDYPFPSFIKRVIDRVDDFEVWGDGTQVRDFIHMDDVVEATMNAIVLNIQYPLNLGTGRPVSFNEFAEVVFRVANWRPKNGLKHLLDKPVGVHYRCCDPTNMLKVYQPKITLEDGVRRAIIHMSR